MDSFSKKNDKFDKSLYAINLTKFEKQISASYIRTEELKCKAVENGIILPLRKIESLGGDGTFEGGVCDESFNFVAGYKRRNDKKFNSLECVRPYKVNSEQLDRIDEDVVFGGVAYNHFGHFLVETFNRLWWVVKNELFDKKVVFLKEKNFDASFLTLIELVGIKKENIIYLDNATKFKSVQVPDQSLYYFNYFYKEYVYPYQAIMDNVTPGKDRKVYLSRTQFKKKDIINEEYFESFYRDLGYKIVYPEQIDIREQISIVSGADEIVSTMGTISHLALFSKKGTKIVTLLRARNYFNKTQAIVNQSKELDYTFVDVTCNFLPHRYSANCYYIGPNITWVDFVKKEYGIELDINLIDYLNSDNSHMGDYFEQWLKVFKNKRQIKKIQADNSIGILNNLEVVFADKPTDFKPTPEKLAEDLIEKARHDSDFIDKIFQFSRYDGSHARTIRLDKSGIIKSIGHKDNSNESFWTINKNELNFLNKEKVVTSRYFCTKKKDDGLFLLGYYLPNKEIVFRLKELPM